VAVALVLLLPAGVAASSGPGRAPDENLHRYREAVRAMKENPRGPFRRIRWFCADGTVLPPRGASCAPHGGGIQHGEWSETTLRLREAGYRIANVLAEIDPSDHVGPEARRDELAQILIERFLIEADDGWIFRRARSYRGALQAEDEEAGARRLLLALVMDPGFERGTRYFPVREAARLLPAAARGGSTLAVRQLAVRIADRDPGFAELRAKIHSLPDAGDAERVRRHARERGLPALAGEYEELAAGIEALYAAGRTAEDLREAAGRLAHAASADLLRELAARVEGAEDRDARLAEAASALGRLRARRAGPPEASDRVTLLGASLALEREVYTLANDLAAGLAGASRDRHLDRLLWTATALYGTGLITARHLAGVRDALARLRATASPPLREYRSELRYLGRMPEWCSRTLAFHFGPAERKLAEIEPLAHLYPQDRLRGSPLLAYGGALDRLVQDGNRLAGLSHQLFGRPVGSGLRALNPGLARGVLRVPDATGTIDFSDPEGIYLLPETTSDLPPVGGILTRGEGSSLSHVQLLARNLGIPNVVVGEEHLDDLVRRAGWRVFLAVSPGGVVRLELDRPDTAALLGAEGTRTPEDVVIRPDLEKLDLERAEPIPLRELRASDSGRVCGPKGANLGELMHDFGDRVPPGFVLPFGVFRRLLDQPLEPGGPPVFEWMKARYREIAALEGDPRREEVVRTFLARLRAWIEQADPGPAFWRRLREDLTATFGEEGSYGLFVRSDTNVEDLPGFTGAGLNLTLPNVVGFDALRRAIGRVWASPFTERAWSWRQAHMERPEYVFPAVVLQYSFPSEKSGVMVTADVVEGRPGWISIAVNEGVGGAVEGQAAESLRVHLTTGEVRFLAQATAPRRRELDPAGGIREVPASGTEAVLLPDEIEALRKLALEVPRRFPELRDAEGRPAPADIEFAFAGGRMALLQMRPFVESRRARASAYLESLDASLEARAEHPVDLARPPGG